MHPTLGGHLAMPVEPGPAILVVHDWYGVLPHLRGRCEELRAAGYLAFAVDLYGGRHAADEVEAEALMQDLARTDAEAALGAAVTMLREHPFTDGPVAAIGYSMGAPSILASAADLDLAAAAVYYGMYEGDAVDRLTCPLLGHLAGTDDFDPSDAAEAFFAERRAAGVDAQAFTYPGTLHSFANADTKYYDPEADDLAWQRTMDFLDRVLTR